MNNDGLSKIEISANERDAIITHHEVIRKMHKECEKRIKGRAFHETYTKRSLFFNRNVEKFNEDACEAAFPELFNYATLYDWGADYGGVSVHLNKSYDELCDVASLVKTSGTVYLTPKQCVVFRRATQGAAQ